MTVLTLLHVLDHGQLLLPCPSPAIHTQICEHSSIRERVRAWRAALTLPTWPAAEGQVYLKQLPGPTVATDGDGPVRIHL